MWPYRSHHLNNIPGISQGLVTRISLVNLRSQRTRANNPITDEVERDCGVPQGKVLGPSLFLVNEDDIPHARIQKYVDDMTNQGKATLRYRTPSTRCQNGLHRTKWKANTKKRTVIKFWFNKLVNCFRTLKMGYEVNLLSALSGVAVCEILKWYSNRHT